MSDITEVIEVAETRSRRVANVYLSRGYRLLSAGAVHFERRTPPGQPNAGQPQVLRVNEYVLGRTGETEALTLKEAIALADPRGTSRKLEAAEDTEAGES